MGGGFRATVRDRRPEARRTGGAHQCLCRPPLQRLAPRRTAAPAGRLQCAAYDLGGEGVAYHDSTPANQGSGTLTAISMNSGASRRSTPASPRAIGAPRPRRSTTRPSTACSREMGQLYVAGPSRANGSTTRSKSPPPAPAPWTCFTPRGMAARSRCRLTGRTSSGLITLESTEDRRDPLDWRQWHHWDLRRDAARAALPAGRHCADAAHARARADELCLARFPAVLSPGWTRRPPGAISGRDGQYSRSGRG